MSTGAGMSSGVCIDAGQELGVLRTERLILRQLTLADADFILELLNEPAFLEFIGDKGVRNVADACEYLRRGPMDSYFRFGFGLYRTGLRDGSPIGICGLVKREGLSDPDVGFAFLSRYRAQGYATESASAVLEYGHRVLRLRRIVAITTVDNFKSIAVVKKIGLRFECLVRLPNDDVDLKLFGPASADGGS